MKTFLSVTLSKSEEGGIAEAKEGRQRVISVNR